MSIFLFLMYAIFTLIVLYHGLNARVWEAGSVLYLVAATFLFSLPLAAGIFLWLFIITITLFLELSLLRDGLADRFFKRAQKTIPKLSKTEEEALNAGDTWLEQDIFVGSPDWDRLSEVDTALTEEEQAFLDTETQILCEMLDEWKIQQDKDLSPEVWSYIKDNGFFGLVIAKKYGGKGFSARAHSDVVIKLASRSGVAAVTVMVPNSLGPGELLQHYGTEEQKNYYLPRLASGLEVPCFALTEPEAGSDATSLRSEAIVVKKKIDGKTILGLNINLNKRWITLAPVATLIGLAVNVKDPDGLLKGEGTEGITCLLIPRDVENLEIGNRHLAAGQPFMNGSIRAKNIFVPITNIIGGQKQAGRGWQMLVECLAIGRSISLPALAAGTSALCYLTTGAFSRIRRQFNVEIAQFEGIEEKLAEIAGLTYLIQATRLLTVAAVNQDKKPSVASAIGKYFNTELGRIVVNNAMDIHAGRGVVIGPRNYLFNAYQSTPISITVEGANIMSRNLLIFGQGSMACHPFVREEFYAVTKDDKQRFRSIFWEHISYFMTNFAKTICSAWTGGIFILTPQSPLRRKYQKLTRLSYAFSWVADLALITLGGNLKRKERLSARLADAMSFLYMALAAIRLYQRSNFHQEENLHAQWAISYCLYHAQKAMLDFTYNLPSKFLGFFIRLCAFPWGQTMQYPSDKLDHMLAKTMTQNNHFRNSLKKMIFINDDTEQPVGRIEAAFQALIESQDLYKKVGNLKGCKFIDLQEKLTAKVQAGEITPAELNQLLEIEKLRWDAIQVDEFAFEAVKKKTFESLIY